MYAFGDVSDPLPDTVDALEDVLVNFIVDTCHDAIDFAKVTKRQKIKVDDFAFSWRRDPVKYGRVFELLRLQEVINKARKQYQTVETKASYKDMDDDDEDADDTNINHNNENATESTEVAKSNKKVVEPERKKRKYTKSGKERKPYKKRAKKTDTPAT